MVRNRPHRKLTALSSAKVTVSHPHMSASRLDLASVSSEMVPRIKLLKILKTPSSMPVSSRRALTTPSLTDVLAQNV